MPPECVLRRAPVRAAGFSLIELIVVITIIGILAATVVVNLAGRTDQAKIAAVKNDFHSIKTASSMFREDHGRWPDSLEELMSPPESPSGFSVKNYLDKLPIDPWTNEPYYFEPSDDGVLIISYGADKTEGGEGINEDIASDDDRY